MKLQDLISKTTRVVDSPMGETEVDKHIPAESKPDLTPLAEEKKSDAKKEEGVVSEEEIVLAGEINCDLFCAAVETPLIIYNSIAAKRKTKKAKQQMKGDKLDERLKEIAAWKKSNEEIIYIEKKEYDRLSSAFTKLARLNKGKPSESLLIGGAIVATLAKRIEIFVE